MSKPTLPVELIIRIIQLSLDDSPNPIKYTSACRIYYLASLRLVSRTFDRIARQELFRKILVSSHHQLASYSRFFQNGGRHLACHVEELQVNWDDREEGLKRNGGKEWRKAIKAFCTVCKRLKSVTLRGPERSAGLFFCADWLEDAKDTLEHLSLNRISLAAYPEVSDIRFPRLKSLELSFCHPYSVSQLPCFYSHFPSLASLTIDNENIDRALTDAVFTPDPSPTFLSSLRSLTLPQTAFLRLFTPFPNHENLHQPGPHLLPACLEFLSLKQVTFPPALLPPFVGMVLKYAEMGGSTIRRLETQGVEGNEEISRWTRERSEDGTRMVREGGEQLEDAVD